MTIVYKLYNTKHDDFFFIGSSSLSPTQTLTALRRKANRFQTKQDGKMIINNDGWFYKRKSLVEIHILGLLSQNKIFGEEDVIEIEILAEGEGKMTEVKNNFIRKEKDNFYLLNERIPLTTEQKIEYNKMSKKNKSNLTYSNKLEVWKKFKIICEMYGLGFEMEKPLPKDYKKQTDDWLKKIPQFLVKEAFSVLGDNVKDNDFTKYLKKRYKDLSKNS